VEPHRGMVKPTLLPVGTRVNRASTGCLPVAISLRGMTIHHSHRFARLVAAGLAAGALAAPAAVAQPIDGQPSAASDSAPTNTPIVQTIDEGFDWGSAAIGAGGAGAVFMLASVGGLAYVSRGRMRAAR
jgi:hypothetical protein